MRNLLRKAVCLIGVAAMAISITACGKNNLVGRWETSDKAYIEFYSDGTYTTNEANYSGKYSTDNGRIKLTGVLVPDISAKYKVSGNTLTIYDEDGEVEEEYKKSK